MIHEINDEVKIIDVSSVKDLIINTATLELKNNKIIENCGYSIVNDYLFQFKNTDKDMTDFIIYNYNDFKSAVRLNAEKYIVDIPKEDDDEGKITCVLDGFGYRFDYYKFHLENLVLFDGFVITTDKEYNNIIVKNSLKFITV